MRKFVTAFKQFPIVFLFLAFLGIFAVVDELWPKRERSELENRSLAQRPAFSLQSVLEEDSTQTWMAKYDTYTRDQVALRDEWINLKSITEGLLLKTENNGVWYGKNDMMFAKMLSIGTRFENNLNALEKMCERHPGLVDVMIVPSASLALSDLLPMDAPIADEGAALDQVTARLGEKATVYDLRGTLGAHQDEYIYYRTDHHWTADGAFYAYEDYVCSKGMTPLSRDNIPWKTVEDFYGTNYSSARKWNAVPDVIRYPDFANQLTVYDVVQEDGSVKDETGGLYELSYFDTRDKYRAFLRGNNAFSTIQGNGEGKLLVVKDSYANSFIPYLVDHYAEISVVDFRANNQRIDQILSEGDYDRVLVLYSFNGFATDTTLAGKIGIAG